jgi:ubiquinone/menaquinone biosynthesis C-methylase UbiE
MWSTGALSEVEKLLCLDVSPAMLEVAAGRASRLCPDACALIVVSADALPFRYEAFDVAYSFLVVNLLEAPERAVSEIARASSRSLVTLLKAFRIPEMRGWRPAGEAGKDLTLRR